MGLQIEIGGITNLLVRRVVREASKKTLDGAVVVRFIAQADKEILAKIRGVVESAGLTDGEIKHAHFDGVYDYPDEEINEVTYSPDDVEADKRVIEAHTQAILKAMGEVK